MRGRVDEVSSIWWGVNPIFPSARGPKPSQAGGPTARRPGCRGLVSGSIWFLLHAPKGGAIIWPENGSTEGGDMIWFSTTASLARVH